MSRTRPYGHQYRSYKDLPEGKYSDDRSRAIRRYYWIKAARQHEFSVRQQELEEAVRRVHLPPEERSWVEETFWKLVYQAPAAAVRFALHYGASYLLTASGLGILSAVAGGLSA